MTGIYQRRRLPPLNALRAFEAAARHLSFKEAANELNVSQSAVSHQVKTLEDVLGTSLFTRKVRAVELTRKGRLYYPILRAAFESIAEGTQVILEETSIAVFTLHVYSTFTIRWLLPRLAGFQEAHPDIQVRLHTSQADVNFDQNDIDAAIMIGQPVNPNLHYDYLFDCELFPVCSPLYLERNGSLNDPSELARHPLLQVYPSAGDWHVWLEANDVRGVQPDSGLQFESYDVALSSAVQGMGIALGQQPYVEREFASGTLVEVFPSLRIPNPNRWFLACRSDKRHAVKLDTFRRWLLNEAGADPALKFGSSVACNH